MFKTTTPIYLASKSPRRKKLLKQLGINFKSFHVDLDEIFIKNESPIKTVKRLALEKMFEAEKVKNNGIIITADTIVVLKNEIIGKPKDSKDAKNILKKLSNNKHFVYTGFAVKNCTTEKVIVSYEKTEVTFRNLKTEEIDDYVATGSPMDKAGAYGIQDDFGAVFISKINGCYYNVVGLPLAKLYTSLNEVIWLENKILKNIFIAIIVAIVLYLALSIYGNIEIVFSTLVSFKWEYFPIVLAIIYISFLFKFLKWQYYLKLIKVNIKVSDSFQIFMSSLTMSITPGKIGEIIKSYMIKQLNGTPTSRTIPIVFAERITEIFALIFLIIMGFDLLNKGLIILIATFLLVLFSLFLLLNENVSNWLIDKLGAIKLLQKYLESLKLSIANSRELLKPKPFALMFLLSVVIWIIECFGFYLILSKFNINFSIVWSFFSYLFSIFIGSISFLPGGLGITDGSITYLLIKNGIDKDIAVSSTLIIRVTTLWFALIIGSISLYKFNKSEK